MLWRNRQNFKLPSIDEERVVKPVSNEAREKPVDLRSDIRSRQERIGESNQDKIMFVELEGILNQGSL